VIATGCLLRKMFNLSNDIPSSSGHALIGASASLPG